MLPSEYRTASALKVQLMSQSYSQDRDHHRESMPMRNARLHEVSLSELRASRTVPVGAEVGHRLRTSSRVWPLAFRHSIQPFALLPMTRLAAGLGELKMTSRSERKPLFAVDDYSSSTAMTTFCPWVDRESVFKPLRDRFLDFGGHAMLPAVTSKRIASRSPAVPVPSPDPAPPSQVAGTESPLGYPGPDEAGS